MELNYTAIIVATIAQFIFGAIWYTPIFGKTWGKIHGFDQVALDKQKEMMKEMGKLLVTQFILTLVTTVVFALLLTRISPDWNIYWLAFLFWLGFVMPTQVAGIIFGGTKPGWIMTKIFIAVGAGLGCMEIIAVVFKLMM
jgi:hypothetical protein